MADLFGAEVCPICDNPIHMHPHDPNAYGGGIFLLCNGVSIADSGQSDPDLLPPADDIGGSLEIPE